MSNSDRYRLRIRSARISKWLVVLGCLAAGTPLATGADGKDPAETEVDVKASRVFIHVRKSGLGHEHAVVGQVKSGALHRGRKKGAGELVFDMPTFAADTAEARKYVGLKGATGASMQKDVTANMLGADVLDVGKFPTATFTIASATRLAELSAEGHPQYRLEGEFTLHGVKQPLKFDAEEIADENGVRLRGAFTIRQTDFGIQPYSKAFGTIGVADELTIYGEMQLRKSAPAAPGKNGRNPPRP